MCALVLTIPFGFFQYFNADFFSDLEVNINSCLASTSRDEYNKDFNAEYNDILRNVSTCITASLSALVMAVLYYLFKPDEFEMDIFMRRNGKLLLGSILTLTR